MGGLSSEREVSFSSGKGVIEALRKGGYEVKGIDLTKDINAFIQELEIFKPDVVFNALHGRYGEDGSVQGLLNLLDIPYTHSGVLASAVGMNKEQTKRIARMVGIPVAEGGLYTKSEMENNPPQLPYVAKPNADGSSFGVVIVRTPEEHHNLLKNWGDESYKLVEEYIPGHELSAAVLNDMYLGTLEIVPKTGFYDYKNKYTEGRTTHIVPAPISKEAAELVKEYTLKIHKTLGCRGVSRSDFRYDDSDPKNPRVVFLEINTNPGMTPFSLVPDIAKQQKISYDELVDELVKEARCD